MHINWNWIKQRPHFLYEELSYYIDIDLYYVDRLLDQSKHKINNVRNTYRSSEANKITKLPLSGRYTSLQQIEKLINRKICLKQYNYIWITSPLILEFIPLKELEGKQVIYDCMDDFLEFYHDSDKINRMKELELELVQVADIVITSSGFLKDKMQFVYGKHLKQDPILINNGVSSSLVSTLNAGGKYGHRKTGVKSQFINLTYIGTIGNWVDFELILEILNRAPNIIIKMIGPVDTRIPSHPRLHFVGIVDHHDIPHYANESDALIMPFMVNELVQSVDPVKIYEYILFQKPIIAVDYGEMYKFQSFVHLYSTLSDFMVYTHSLEKGELKVQSMESALHFLNQSTWKQRCEKIIEIIKG